jgi:hypothetical protein
VRPLKRQLTETGDRVPHTTYRVGWRTEERPVRTRLYASTPKIEPPAAMVRHSAPESAPIEGGYEPLPGGSAQTRNSSICRHMIPLSESPTTATANEWAIASLGPEGSPFDP